jgi:hypothetical protein
MPDPQSRDRDVASLEAVRDVLPLEVASFLGLEVSHQLVADVAQPLHDPEVSPLSASEQDVGTDPEWPDGPWQCHRDDIPSP